MIKFDTRDKKPKVYNIAVLTFVAVFILALMFFKGYNINSAEINICFVLYLAIVTVMLISAFIKQIQYNPYSYNTIFYIGFAIFIISIIINHIILIFRIATGPDSFNSLHIVYTLAGSQINYIFFSSPFLLLFSVSLFISNISLIRHEGKSFVNALGIILSVMILSGIAVIFRFNYYYSGSENEVMIHELISNLLASIYLYFECMLFGVIVSGAIVARYTPEPDKDFMIILGCGLKKDGTPTPLLKGRIDKAIEFSQMQKEKSGKELIFITSGGQGQDEIIPESASMKNYLTEHGISEEKIVEENKSTDTLENMKFSKEIIGKINPEGKIAFSTTNYHVFRSGLSARRMKMRAVDVGAPTKWYFWPNAAVREFIGLLTAHKVKQIIILSSMIIIYTLLIIMRYKVVV